MKYSAKHRTLVLKQVSFMDTVTASRIESYKLLAKHFPHEEIVNCKE